jgi:hypothetical protein
MPPISTQSSKRRQISKAMQIVLNFRASLKQIKPASLFDYEFSLSADWRISSNAFKFSSAEIYKTIPAANDF